ncbi:MAG: asparagine synthase (glutamine-hydrolyzing) [Bacilli bacterium]
MCGFLGVYYRHPQNATVASEAFMKANEMITHRGPDDEGYWVGEHATFGFRRLSIIDIEAGHQPLTYADERYTIIFNGEIYNYVELREQLMREGLTFKTKSDTEVIVAMYSKYKENAVKQLRGMFGFLIWDNEEKTLFGARDHFGIKPFFFAEREDAIYFGSEKKSILLLTGSEPVDQYNLQHYFSYQYVPEPGTMQQDIKKLEPGHYFIQRVGEPMQIKSYFKPTFQPVQKSRDTYVKEIQDVLRDSVEKHMRSDVPVGSFLSGGIDSSIIATMARDLNPNILTFSVGFEREGFSEVDVAKETAAALGVKNISTNVTADMFKAELPRIMWHMDDPLADPAAIPLYFVAKEAAKHVTVVLSGEGADELFGGYNIYAEPLALRAFEHMPDFLKNGLNSMASVLRDGVRGKSFIQRGCTPIEQRYYGNAKILTEMEKPHIIKLYNESMDYTRVTAPLYERIANYDDITKMQYIDMYTWLRGDILLKADRMTMAHSLELRVPFLDKEVFRVASQLPSNVKVSEQQTKIILREAVKGIVPDHVLERKKLGFPVPIRHWLKDELRDWAIALVEESEVDYLVNKSYVLDLLDAHALGKADHSRKIWTALMFMLWHQIYIEGKYDVSQFIEAARETKKGRMAGV